MTGSPRASVVVPFFESAATLDACLTALRAQDDVPGGFEVILVDNRAPGDAGAIARRHTERDDRVILLEEPTPGAYAARNAGIRAARGTLVAFTDADCVPAPDWLRSAAEALESADVAVAVGRVRYPRQASWALHALGAYENAKTAWALAQPDPAHRFAYGNNMAVRADVFEAIGLFEEWPRAADTELVHRLAARHPSRRVVFRTSMTVTHLEFLRARDRLRRMRRYTGTNARIGTFRELGARDRLAVLRRLLRDLAGAERA